MWASEWPYLRATGRVDCGVMLRFVERLLPDAKDRRKLLWETPAALFGFAA